MPGRAPLSINDGKSQKTLLWLPPSLMLHTYPFSTFHHRSECQQARGVGGLKLSVPVVTADTLPWPAPT